MYPSVSIERSTIKVLGADGKVKEEFVLPDPTTKEKSKRIDLCGKTVVVEFGEDDGTTSVVDVNGAVDMAIRVGDKYFTTETPPGKVVERVEKWNAAVVVYPTANTTIGDVRAGLSYLEVTIKPDVAAKGQSSNFGIRVNRGAHYG